MNKEILNDIDLRNKENYEAWRRKWLEHTETKCGEWVQYKENPIFEVPTFLRLRGAL